MRRIFTRFLFLSLISAVLLMGAPAPSFAVDQSPVTVTGKGAPGGETKKPSDKDVSGGRFVGDPVYVHLAPMVMPIISDEGLEQTVTLLIDVQVKDFDVADQVQSNMPKVMDALMRALYGGLGKGYLRNGKMIDVTKLKARATTALTDVVGPGIVEVLVEGVSQRMF